MSLFLAGGGEMGERTRAFDWSGTCLGAVEGWPAAEPEDRGQHLSRLPLPHRPLVGEPRLHHLLQRWLHPHARGHEAPGLAGKIRRECWSEIWPTIGPMLEGVFAGGEATWSEDLLLVLHRNLPREETYFTFSYGPSGMIPEPSGASSARVPRRPAA